MTSWRGCATRTSFTWLPSLNQSITPSSFMTTTCLLGAEDGSARHETELPIFFNATEAVSDCANSASIRGGFYCETNALSAVHFFGCSFGIWKGRIPAYGGFIGGSVWSGDIGNAYVPIS